MRVIPTLLALALLLPAAPAAADPVPAFPSESGCPSFNADGTYYNEPTGTEEALVTSSMHITGIGLATDGTDLTATIQVENLVRETPPGFRWTYWQVGFTNEFDDNRQLQVFYDSLKDEFSYWTGNGTPLREVSGSAVTGPGGGVSVTIPLADFNLKANSLVSRVWAASGNFVSYVYMNPPDYLTRTWGSGIYQQQWGKRGHELWPVMPCPGAFVKARDRGNAQGALLTGYALPQEVQDVTVERLVDGAWVAEAQLTSSSLGGFGAQLPLPPGTETLRAVVHTRAFGDVVTDPVTVTLTD